jgi:hypothetical protein
MNKYKKVIKFLPLILIFLIISNCEAFKPKKVDTRKVPINAQQAARKNVEEGRGINLNKLLSRQGTNFEFSSSNPLWRASLNVLDFMPLSTVDYSGGIIITDWYKNGNSDESIKITVRFLSNEISSNSLKIIVHKKNCRPTTDCSVNEFNSKINEELLASILKQASLLDSKK